MDIKVLGIDLGKTVCSLAGLDEAGAVVFRQRLQRHRLLDFLATLPPCVVAMEACGGAHHIGRFCLEKRHEPRLMSPLYVRPYVKVHKNDDRDAEAIAEAATRPTMSFVAIKSEEQLDLQALHRARERLVSGPIGRFVRRIPLRRNNERTLAILHHPAHFLVALRFNGREISGSAAPECQSKSPVRMTCAPSEARCTAVAAPMPLLDPVTSAV